MPYQRIISLFLQTLLLLFFLTGPSYPQQTTQPFAEDFFSELTLGYHYFAVKDYRGKVGEYEVLDSGSEASFMIEGHTNENYFSMTGEALDEDDQRYTLDLDLQRILQSTFSYRRFRHFLDHAPLQNQDFTTDFNPGRDNGLTLEEIRSINTLRLPFLAFVKFTMDFRKYSKRGHRQATTVSKCSQCHVSSRNKRVDSSTEDYHFMVEGTAGPATFQYQHLRRSFQEWASAPVNDYGSGASFFLAQGSQPYSRVPDSRTQIHQLKVSSTLPLSSSFFASFQSGKKTNRDTHNDIDFTSYATRLSSYFFRFFSLDVFFNRYHMNNDVPDAIDQDIKRGGFDVSALMNKKTSLKFSYQWQNIDRDNFSQGSTYKEIYRVILNHRPLKKLSFHLKYEKTKIDDPFVLEDEDFRLTQTSLPDDKDEWYLSASWNPQKNFSVNTNIRYIKSETDRYDVDEDRFELILNIWYMPTEKMTLTASFTLLDNEVNNPISFKRYHVRDFSELFFFDDIPYDDRSQSYFISVSYLLNRRISLTGTLTYTESQADYDTQLGAANVGELSDLEIHQIDTSVGVTYLYSKKITLFAKYMFRQYNDREQDFLEGEFNALSIGLNWTF